MKFQGLVSIIDGDKKVIAKVIVGSGASKAREFADYVIEHKICSLPDIPDAIVKAANKIGFGTKSNRVVMLSPTRVITPKDVTLDELYEKTFDNSEFNPRWRGGDGEYSVVMNHTKVIRSKETKD